MAGDPSYDFALTALAADARLHFLISDGSTRIVSATQPRGATRDALLTTIILRSSRALRLVFDRSLRPAVTVALGLDMVAGRITRGRVAIGCAYDAPLTASLPLAEALPPGELAHGAEQLAQQSARRGRENQCFPQCFEHALVSSSTNSGTPLARSTISSMVSRERPALPASCSTNSTP